MFITAVLFLAILQYIRFSPPSVEIPFNYPFLSLKTLYIAQESYRGEAALRSESNITWICIKAGSLTMIHTYIYIDVCVPL